MAAEARRLAVDALLRIEEGAYANLVVPALLDRTGLSSSDRGLVTDLVYGTTRMRRACDWLVDRFLMRPPDDRTREVLRIGAYQLAFARTPAYAAVDATVAVAPGRTRGLVNAVLRRVASSLDDLPWPSEAVRLSYPDWVVARLSDDLGAAVAHAALEAMNVPPSVTTRPDGYVQDLASQWVVAALGDVNGLRVADLCAAPGGKATGLAARGARVAALDVRAARAGLIAANAARLGLAVGVVTADATRAPLQLGAFDVVLVDAPCSGLGVLRRRPDARWRVSAGDVAALAAQERELLLAAAPLVRPGGLLAYSVCTLTAAETVAVDSWAAASLPGFKPAPLGPPWRPVGRGGRLLPQDEGTDGMFLLLLHSVG